MARTEIKRGQRYYSPTFRNDITVMRVAKDGSWADILVTATGGEWSKRQPLTDGKFNFDVVPIG